MVQYDNDSARILRWHRPDRLFRLSFRHELHHKSVLDSASEVVAAEAAAKDAQNEVDTEALDKETAVPWERSGEDQGSARWSIRRHTT